jgi:hypothetical protein
MNQKLRAAAVLCASVAVLLVAAVAADSRLPVFKIDTSQSASAWLASQQGIPTYGSHPSPLDCYTHTPSIGGKYTNYQGLPHCDPYDAGPGGYTAIFSAYPQNSGSGSTRWLYTHSNVHSTSQYAGQPSVCSAVDPDGFGNATYCPSPPVRECYSGIYGDGCSSSYENAANESCGYSHDGFYSSSGTNGSGCYKNVSDYSLSYYTQNIGSAVTVNKDQPVVLEWACQPHQRKWYTECRNWYSWFGYCVSYVESYYTHNYSGSASGSGFNSGGSYNGSTIIYPKKTDTYSLTCGGGSASGASYSPPALSIPVYINPTSLSISANPTSVSYGSPSYITWNAVNAQGCSVNGPGISSGANAGNNQSTGPLYSNATYTLSCYQGSVSASVSVAAPPSASAIISASPTSVYAGQSSTITWSSQNATSCSVSGPGISSSALSSSQSTGALSAGGKTYTINCSGEGGNASDFASVSVYAVPSSCSGSYCNIGCTPSSVLKGGDVSCTWSCNPSIYSSSQGTGFSTGGALSGSRSLNPTESTTYGLACILSGSQTTASAQVTVNQPQLSISANPARVQKGKTATIAWSATNVIAGSCSVTSNAQGGGTWSGASGSQSAVINSSTMFKLSCSVPSGAISQSVTVNLIPQFQEI